MAALKRSFAGAVLAAELFEMLRDARVRNGVRRVLVENYLSGSHAGGMDLKSLAILVAAALLVA